jgi:hypothetical protein
MDINNEPLLHNLALWKESAFSGWRYQGQSERQMLQGIRPIDPLA